MADLREQLYGTADCVMFMPAWGLVRVYDYKHGVGIAVSPVRNGQLSYYGCGALHSLCRDNPEVGNLYHNVELIVVQPRNFDAGMPVKRWRTDMEELMAWFHDELLPAYDRTFDDDAPLVPGDHCRFCNARSFCPALHQIAEELMAQGPEPKTLTDAELAEWLQKVKNLRFLIKGIEDEAYHRATKGNTIPGFKLVPKKSNRKWKSGAEKVLLAKLGEQALEKELLSPAQVEKLRGGKELVQQLAYREETGLTLVSEDDARSGVKPRTAQEAFANV